MCPDPEAKVQDGRSLKGCFGMLDGGGEPGWSG